MKAKYVLAIALSLAVLLMSSSPLMAQPRRGQGPQVQQAKTFWQILYDLEDQLNLTSDQWDDLITLAREHQKDEVVMRADARVIQIDLQALLEVQGNDGAVRNKHGQLQKKENGIAELEVEHHILERRSLFTADQWQLIAKELNAQRQDRPDRDEPDGSRYSELLEKLQAELDLSDDQVADLQEIHAEMIEAIAPVAKELQEARAAMAELIQSTGNNAAVRNQSEEILALKNEIDDLRLESRLESRKVFTSDQWEAYVEHLREQRLSGEKGQNRGPDKS